MTRGENNSNYKNGQNCEEEICWWEMQIANKNIEIFSTSSGEWKLKHHGGTIFHHSMGKIRKLWENGHSYPVIGNIASHTFFENNWQYLLELKNMNHLL